MKRIFSTATDWRVLTALAAVGMVFGLLSGFWVILLLAGVEAWIAGACWAFDRLPKTDELDAVRRGIEAQVAVMREIARSAVERMEEECRVCPHCGTPYTPGRKFNSGNPMIFWLPECDCEGRLKEAEIDGWLARRDPDELRESLERGFRTEDGP